MFYALTSVPKEFPNIWSELILEPWQVSRVPARAYSLSSSLVRFSKSAGTLQTIWHVGELLRFQLYRQNIKNISTINKSFGTPTNMFCSDKTLHHNVDKKKHLRRKVQKKKKKKKKGFFPKLNLALWQWFSDAGFTTQFNRNKHMPSFQH